MLCHSVDSTFANAVTLFAYGYGRYSIIFTKNAIGTAVAGNRCRSAPVTYRDEVAARTGTRLVRVRAYW
jgi:hypothetical protein